MYTEVPKSIPLIQVIYIIVLTTDLNFAMQHKAKHKIYVNNFPQKSWPQ